MRQVRLGWRGSLGVAVEGQDAVGEGWGGPGDISLVAGHPSRTGWSAAVMDM